MDDRTRRSPPPKAPGRRSSPAKLVAVAGPANGEEFVLPAKEVVIGRAKECEISIPDSSVSRQHVTLRPLPTGAWAVMDMGSGNGTLLNGEPIEEESPLSSGDVLTLGDTELSFVEEAAEEPAPPPRRSRDSLPVRRAPIRTASRDKFAMMSDPQRNLLLRRIGIGVAGVIGLVLLIKLVLVGLDWRSARQRAALEERRRVLATIVQQGKNSVRDFKWEEAKASFDEAKQILDRTPQLEEELLTFQVYVEQVGKEIPNAHQLKLAEQALAESKLAAAAKALAAVGPETTMLTKVDELKQALAAKQAPRLAETQAALEAKQWAQAVALAEDLHQAFPDSRDAKVIYEEAKRQLQRANRPAAPPPPPPDTAWKPAVDKFVAGDMKEALRLARACASTKKSSRCAAVAKDIARFMDLNQGLDDMDAKALDLLLQLDERIAGGQRSKMAQIAGTKASSIFYKSASAAKAAGQWGAAAEYARKALNANPDHAPSLAIKSEMQKKASELFFMAYGMRSDPSTEDEALRMFKEVVRMVPPEHELARKAKDRIQELQER